MRPGTDDTVKARITKRPLGVLVLVLAFNVNSLGCAATAPPVKVAPGAMRVVIRKADPPPGYIEMGPISASHGYGCGYFGKKGTYESAYNALRNKAAKHGADYVRIVGTSEPKLKLLGLNVFMQDY